MDDEKTVFIREEPESEPQDTLREVHDFLEKREQKHRENDEDPDKPDMPEALGSSVLKYHKSAEISNKLEDQFDPNVAFFGSHVVNSNTKRIDNLRHLGELDSTIIVRNIPYMRECGTDTKVRTTSEFQMCRSNVEIGGFDQKMGRTNITKEDVDLKQSQNINHGQEKKTGGILGMLHLRGKPT